MSNNILLLSIKPEYADKIFNEKTKQIELRRVRPRLNKGDLILVYVSSPKKAVVGSFKVKKIIKKPITELWEIVEKQAGINHEDFVNYYKGVSVGVAIFFQEIETFKQPVCLELLKEKWSNFHPPQSYRYLTNRQLEIVESLSKN